MKFFKHFTDAHRGKSLQLLFDKHGHTGLSVYWMIVEMCAEKLERPANGSFTEANCRFVFNRRFLRNELRLKNKHFEIILRSISDQTLFLLDLTENEVTFEMPKLLEYLDRDARYTRTEREKTRLELEEELDKEKIYKKETNWNAAASKVLAAISTHGKSEDRMVAIGEELWKIAVAVGIAEIGRTPRNQYTVMNLAKLLKEKAAELEQKEASAQEPGSVLRALPPFE